MPLTLNAGHGPLHRVSVFKELGLTLDGLDGYEDPLDVHSTMSSPSTIPSTKNSTESSAGRSTPPTNDKRRDGRRRWFSRALSYLSSIRPRSRSASSYSTVPSVSALPTLTHVVMLAVLFVLILPGVQLWIPMGDPSGPRNGAEAVVLRTRTHDGLENEYGSRLEARDDSPTAACIRFSHQSAVVNGTLYIYGGQAKTSQDQKSDTWNNNFMSLPLTKAFPIGSPPFKGLPQPSGPPPVANGYLWNSYTSLYLYGGLFSDTPPTEPVPFSLWEYDLTTSTWKEHKDPQTSAGNNSEPAGRSIQRAAEGAGVSVPELGRAWYFGGHMDHFTTPGWSIGIDRIYLKSFIEYTFPGAKNDAVESLAGGKTAGSEGVWRNITQAGIQDVAGFTYRADGVLLYIPGFGRQGILLGLAGGTNLTFTQMNVIDVYDIATSAWYKQATDGEWPGIRVNPCAVVAAAADGSSYNVHMYGGQNLIPYGQQKQYDDVWILTIPSFTWIKVDTKGQSNPPARAGHTCSIWDGQMIVVGGYVGQDLTCDTGVYVFDLSTLKWETQFKALTGSNPLDQHPSQQKHSDDTNQIGLGGSYGYRIPPAVRSVIGGNENGGATVTSPASAASATIGPIATGKPATFTVTQGGAVVTQTGIADPRNPSGSNHSNKKDGPNIAAIIAGVLAGVLGIAAGYFAFCAWIYRKQLALYKNHVAMSQRAAMTNTGGEKGGFMGIPAQSSTASRPGSSRPAKSSTEEPMGFGGSSSGGQPSTGTPPRIYGGSANSSSSDLISGQQPSFLGIVLSPRRSLRVINRD
ncbi:MAG: hypothetical protein M1816_007724 [Peltula sp. TS41687]|nr:MAG: hypothetical protein M1816_007724 [Peltula sp. TS41687]